MMLYVWQEGRALLKEVVEMENSLDKDDMSQAEKRSPYKVGGSKFTSFCAYVYTVSRRC
jgi:hypothetical protein